MPKKDLLMRKHIAIAIDGPSGSGKSTLAKSLASHFGFVYIDTGALYRTVALAICRAGVEVSDKDAVVRTLGTIHVGMSFVGGASVPFLNGEDVSAFIRTPEISSCASYISAIPEVRAFLLSLQKDIAASENVVMDGRDIGTVIIPDAQVKIFLTASEDDRADRRFNELIEKGADVRAAEIKKQMVTRDKNDRSRAQAPAIPADDAVILDNSGFTREETFRKALEIIGSRAAIDCTV